MSGNRISRLLYQYKQTTPETSARKMKQTAA